MIQNSEYLQMQILETRLVFFKSFFSLTKEDGLNKECDFFS